MALYAFDGTGNEDRPGTERDSNVLHFFNAYQDPPRRSTPRRRAAASTSRASACGRTPPSATSSPGRSAWPRTSGCGRRGSGSRATWPTATRRSTSSGFSRGAALAIDFANHVCKNVRAANVRFVGVWDIVAQFGLPGEHVNLGFDLDCPDVVAYHAMAIDENRAFFPLTRLSRAGLVFDKLREVWFRGVHSDVGGGNGNRGLNCITLNWMFDNALRHGLPIDRAAIDTNLTFRSLPRAITPHDVAIGPHRRFATGDMVHATVEFSDDDRRRFLDDPRITLSSIDDAGARSPLRATARNA